MWHNYGYVIIQLNMSLRGVVRSSTSLHTTNILLIFLLSKKYKNTGKQLYSDYIKTLCAFFDLIIHNFENHSKFLKLVSSFYILYPTQIDNENNSLIIILSLRSHRSLPNSRHPDVEKAEGGRLESLGKLLTSRSHASECFDSPIGVSNIAWSSCALLKENSDLQRKKTCVR